jgi:hypothetical protein
VRRPGKGDVPAPALLEPVQDLAFTPTSPSRGELVLPRAGQQKHYSLRAEAGGPCPKRLRRTVTIVVPIYGFTQQWFYLRKNPSRGIITAQRHKQKNIHTANEERQVFIKRKFDDYKSSPNRYPKKCQVLLARGMLAFLGPARAPHGLRPGEARVGGRRGSPFTAGRRRRGRRGCR